MVQPLPLPPPLQIMIGHVTMEPHPTRIRSGHVLKQRKFTFQHFLTILKGIITVEIYHNFVSNRITTYLPYRAPPTPSGTDIFV